MWIAVVLALEQGGAVSGSTGKDGDEQAKPVIQGEIARMVNPGRSAALSSVRGVCLDTGAWPRLSFRSEGSASPVQLVRNEFPVISQPSPDYRPGRRSHTIPITSWVARIPLTTLDYAHAREVT